MKANIFFKLSLFVFVILISSLLLVSCSSSKIERILPGKYESHIQLPNGWRLTPIGEHISIGEFPLNAIVIENEKYLITSNSGTKENSLSVIDLERREEVQRLILEETWRGLAYDNLSNKLFVSGGNKNLIYIFKFENEKLTLLDSIIIGNIYPKEKISITGLDFSPKFKLLFAGTREDSSVYVISTENNQVIKRIKLDHKIYDVCVIEEFNYMIASLWSGSSIAIIDLSTLEEVKRIKTGQHPSELIYDEKHKRIFTANANENSVSVINLNELRENERLNVSLNTEVPPGSTPNALALDKNRSQLFIANADNNYVCIYDVSNLNHSKVIGFIPTGWYPTAVKYISKLDEIIVINGKGLSSQPNPKGPDPTNKEQYTTEQYIGWLFKGSVSFIKYPNEEQLSKYSQMVYKNSPYTQTKKIEKTHNLFSLTYGSKKSERIKYIFYVIKENRTYDQIFGDIKKGMGDSSLCIFPYQITPNHHKLAEEFVLFDNFYVDAEVSADGHNWSTAAYATDYTEKLWPVLYGGRGGSYDFEGGVPAARPYSGYIWNLVINAGLRLRNYGEFVQKNSDGTYSARDEDLNNFTCRTFPGYDLSISDLIRFEKWKKDFQILLENDSIPNFSIVRLPNDHTAGTRIGSLTPQAYVAQNDYALGLLVEEISKSKIWKESVIFVVEDDAQNGSDHIDAHRSILLVISPYVKRGIVDHNMYSTSSVLKTIELILGLPPLTQFDISANPISYPFTDKEDLTPYTAISPLIDINETNKADAYKSERCAEFDLTREDAIPDIEFNEIIWKAIRGRDSEMPAPVRSAFVRIIEKEN